MTELKNLKKKVSINLSVYDGVKTTVKVVELGEEETKTFNADEGERKVRQIIIESDYLDKEEKITAREYISLKYDNEDKEWVIPIAPNSKANKVLTKFKIENFDELKGREVVTNLKTRNNGKEYLGMSLGF